LFFFLLGARHCATLLLRGMGEPHQVTISGVQPCDGLTLLETSGPLHSFKRIAERSQVLKTPFARFRTEGKKFGCGELVDFSAVVMTNLNDAACE
jgi:hypothetical protein